MVGLPGQRFHAASTRLNFLEISKFETKQQLVDKV